MSNKANNNNNEKQVENFTTVWDSVRRAKTVNGLQFKAIDKLLYSYLLGWQVSKDDPDNKKVTKVNSSVRELQQELGVSKGTIETSLKTLEKMGLIVIKSGGVGFSNEYDVRKFDSVVSATQDVKKDDFMVAREQYRADNQTQVVGVKLKEIKQNELRDPFLDDCGVSHDSAFEEYNSTRGTEPCGSINTQPKPIKSVAPTKPKANTYDNGYGRKCSQCYQQPNGDWDCRDSYCNNYLPF